MTIDRRKLIAAASLLGASAFVPAVAARALSEGEEARIKALIGAMTLAEKLGQMTQVAGGRQKALNSKLDDAMLARVRNGEVGSFLHVAGAEPLKALQKVAVEQSRLKIPLLFAMDVIHGYRTIFPVPLALAASWDPEVAQLAARTAAEEAWAAGLHWTFTPMVDIARDPRWGRVVEGAGEDPYLGSRMAEAQVYGFQGTQLNRGKRVMACAKHFAGYGAAIGGRDYDSADLSDRALFEVYLPPFFAALSAGVGSFMTAFNDIAGVPATANADLVRGTLFGRWGFDGLVVSDWNAIAELINHGVAETPAGAAVLALRAGVSMDMMSNTYATHLADAVTADASLVPLVDGAVTRILATKARLGLFDDPYGFGDAALEAAPPPEHTIAARNAARRSIVLLRNDGGLLPIDATKKVALIGTLADDASSMLGSWRARGQVDDVRTLRAAMENAHWTLEYQPGASPRSDDVSGISAAVAAAQRADVVLLAIGEDYDFTGEARSRATLDLPGAQAALVAAIKATGKPIVAILFGGRPLAIEKELEGIPAVLAAWLPGVQGGMAILDVLDGVTNPGGKLPIGFPRTTGQVPIPYAHAPTGRPANPDLAVDSARYHDEPLGPLFPFGHGLSYTSFAYTRLAVFPQKAVLWDKISVTLTVTNTGTLRGEEVVQLYARDPVASIERPVLELRGFVRVALEAGQSKQVTFTLLPEQFAFWKDDRWTIEPGRIELFAGGSSVDLQANSSFEIVGSGTGTRPPAAIPTAVEVA